LIKAQSLNHNQNERAFAASLLAMLEQVLSGEISHTELQCVIDNAVTQSSLPENMPADLVRHVHALQLDLEMIAVAIDAETRKGGLYSLEERKNILQKYEALLRPFAI
jgi:hypothetical protein